MYSEPKKRTKRVLFYPHQSHGSRLNVQTENTAGQRATEERAYCEQFAALQNAQKID